jgi:predicted permease
MLARAVIRRREAALCLALGAGRGRLIRQRLAEALLLAAFGGAGGVLVASWVVSVLAASLSAAFPISLDLSLDRRVLAFTGAVSCATALACGLLPALRAARIDPLPVLKAGGAPGRDRRPLGRTLDVLQVAVSIVLLVGAGLFVRTLQNLNHLDAGFNRDGVLIMNINPLETIYQGPRRTALWKDILRRAETLPGVRAASLSTLSPLDGSDRGVGVEVSGYNPNTERDKHIRLNQVSPGYFRVMGIALLQGRDFTERDNETGPKAALLNETAARFYFGNQSPLGAQVRFLRGPGRPPTEPYEIVGVVKDSRDLNLRDEVERLIYLPTLQARDGLGRLTLAVRADGKPADLAGALRNEINAAGSDILVANVSTLSEQVNQTLIQERLVAALSIGFGLLALLLACIGLYGVMSYSAARRTHEIGIRIALGAQRIAPQFP